MKMPAKKRIRNIGLKSIALYVHHGCTEKEYYTVAIDNPVYRKNIAFKYFEDLFSPKFQHLITKYQLETIFHGEKDEFIRILLLSEWIKAKTIIKIDNDGDSCSGRSYVLI